MRSQLEKMENIMRGLALMNNKECFLRDRITYYYLKPGWRSF